MLETSSAPNEVDGDSARWEAMAAEVSQRVVLYNRQRTRRYSFICESVEEDVIVGRASNESSPRRHARGNASRKGGETRDYSIPAAYLGIRETVVDS